MSGSAIPASQIVSVVPSVLNAGGTGLELNGLLVHTDNNIPIGEVYSFPNLIAVQQFFGPTSYISMLAATYFLADINATKRPGALLMTCYSNNYMPGWLRSAQLPSLTLSQLKAIPTTSVLKLTIDGTDVTSAAIDLSAVTSFSEAAIVMGASLNHRAGAVGASFTGESAGTTLTVTTMAVDSPRLNIGDLLAGGVGGSVTAGTYIKAQLTNTNANVPPLAGREGTYQLSVLCIQPPSTALHTVRNACTWDAATFRFKFQGGNAVNPPGTTPSMSYPIMGAGGTTVPIAATLKLVPTLGALLQPMGTTAADFKTPRAFMDGVVADTQNWCSFATAFNPDGTSGGSGQKQSFAAWANAQLNNYLYVCWDIDANAIAQDGSTTLARILNTSLSSGTAPIYSPTVINGRNLAMFTMGTIAAIDFNRLEGRKTLAFRSQTGIAPDITKGGDAANLERNFYNYYGIWTTSNDLFRFLYPGVVSGPYRWLDSYVNQIWMNNGFQLALMNLLTSVGSIPYNDRGYTLIKAACQDVINRAVNFGAIRAGVTLSEAQKAEVNNMAGVRIDTILNTVGYFLQVLDADPQVRANRGSPPATFWYMDGGSVQRINLASILVQ